ncbi:phosphoribosylformylglycinamidine cyclo-ligase [Aquella oligotrophica]|uniref:Phosphoribosylformylglycinamidine cyclo-ligase n=1 Tax=Aquella oligotrophica TaxID=2067065 RepID=A0A2I7N7R4_9NEIS|nr:phosphoribosylformylglycinamidine cyclo-ligase [Aquella oligotrophica]AUR52497.1 phosphoribosylformylglycinamidine cyclo-ligase [Aquella oligotrophica]
MVTYKSAGVDKEEGYKSVGLIKDMVKRTYNKNVLTELGSFGALYELGKYNNPVLVSGTDGVGTKLKIAFTLNKYNTIGIDCVAMCVNDILCHGAKPLFFLDYLACGRLDAEVAAQIVSGITEGCLQSGAALVGGETAEMPGFYQPGEYDIAGFAVGVVEKDAVITGDKIREGDVIIGLPSSGVHSNGFSLVRKLITDLTIDFNGMPIGEALLTPTKIYVKPVLAVLEKFAVNGMAHITGGGLYENIPRVIPDGLCATIDKAKIKALPIFDLIEKLGVPREEMYGTFNMGLGFVMVVNPDNAANIVKILEENGEFPEIIGTITSGNEKICLK